MSLISHSIAPLANVSYVSYVAKPARSTCSSLMSLRLHRGSGAFIRQVITGSDVNTVLIAVRMPVP